MAILYKLTNKKKQTKNNTTWEEGVTHSGTGKGPLCGEGWIHAYRHPLLAVFFNHLHTNFDNPLLWEAEGEVGIDDGIKVGCQTLTTVRQIKLPEMSVVQRVACGILAAQEVHKRKKWNEWADKWLSGEDRSVDSARDMRQKTYNYATYYAVTSATYATSAAYYAACYAAYYAAYAASAVSSSIYYAAYAASYAVSYAAKATEIKKEKLDPLSILEKAIITY